VLVNLIAKVEVILILK